MNTIIKAGLAATLAAGALFGTCAGAASAADTTPKPGLISSDRLIIDRETGELNGDEPVMLTVQLQSVLGQPGSTKVNVVNSSPGEIGSGVDAGDQITIPDRDGDVWFGVQPLTADAVMAAVENKQPVPIPVVATATVMLEGDMSSGERIGAMGQTVADHLQRNLAPELENTRIMMDDAGQASGYSDALARISQAAKPDSATLTKLVIQRITDWAASVSDPDDPVGVSMTALIPVDDDVTSLLDVAGGPGALGLDSQYQKVDTVEVRTKPFDTDIEVRTGMLVPPSALGGKEQSWWTTYSGDYLYDDPASYRVWTHAWPQITW